MQRHSSSQPPNAAEARFTRDEGGRLRDPVIKKRLGEMAGQVDIEQLEALAALRLAAKQVHAVMEHWTESHGVSESRLRLLMALYFSPGRHQALRDLAAAMDVVPRTVTDVADILERDGLVKRVPDAADRRSVHAHLTEAGVKLVTELKRDAVAKQAALLAGFSRDQLAELRHLCLLLVERLENEGGC